MSIFRRHTIQDDLSFWYQIDHKKYHHIYKDKVAWVLSDSKEPYWMDKPIKRG